MYPEVVENLREIDITYMILQLAGETPEYPDDHIWREMLKKNTLFVTQRCRQRSSSGQHAGGLPLRHASRLK